MPPTRKTKPNKHAREDDEVATPRVAKKSRVLSPLRSKDREDSARTQKKIMVELRKELETCKKQADKAAQLKQQRDFAVHVAASLNNLQSKIFDAWQGDIEKSKGMQWYKGSVKKFNKMGEKVAGFEELLNEYPRLATCLEADIGNEEIESLNGWVQDFKVNMVGKDGRKRGNSSESSNSGLSD